jgi:hypothetical protein
MPIEKTELFDAWAHCYNTSFFVTDAVANKLKCLKRLSYLIHGFNATIGPLLQKLWLNKLECFSLSSFYSQV